MGSGVGSQKLFVLLLALLSPCGYKRTVLLWERKWVTISWKTIKTPKNPMVQNEWPLVYTTVDNHFLSLSCPLRMCILLSFKHCIYIYFSYLSTSLSFPFIIFLLFDISFSVATEALYIIFPTYYSYESLANCIWYLWENYI